MGGLSIWHWMLFAAVALLLFGGKGKISDIMGDVAKGVKSFKKGLSDDDENRAAFDREPGRRRRQRRSQGRLSASFSTPVTRGPAPARP
jgi:sec-independent protein translocase protein TatA